MKVNFFKEDCRTLTKAERFGLCDDEDKTPAKVKFEDEHVWNATIKNDSAKEVDVTAIDNCINILRENGEMESRCDVMMRYDGNLLFIELKNKRDSWQAEGLAQIEATILKMIEENREYYFGFQKRKAVVANAKNQFPAFQEYNLEQRAYFMKNYKARIQFEAEILIS